MDRVENLTHTNAKNIRIRENGIEEKFVYQGDVNQLLRELSKRHLEDLVIEEPPLDEIFMHYYEEKEGGKEHGKILDS